MIFLACNPAPKPVHVDAQLYAEALQLLETDPARGVGQCEQLVSLDLRSDCLHVAAGTLAPQQPEQARALCERITDPLFRDECGFVLAEHTHDPRDCDAAGRFAADCQLHLLQQSLSSQDFTGPADPRLTTFAEQSGLEQTDPRLLTLLFRHALSQQHPLDLHPCAQSLDPTWCERAGGGLFHDRLNHARDTGAISAQWCAGDHQSIHALQHVAHPVLEQAIAEREDLCL